MSQNSCVTRAIGSALLYAAASTTWAAECPKAAQLKGSFGLDIAGRTAAGAPYVALGIVQLERGKVRLQLTRSENGALREQRLDGFITSEQCAVKLTTMGDPDGFSLQGQIVAPGDQWLVTEVRSRNPVVASGSLRRIGLRNCSKANLGGSYVYVTQGYQRAPDGTSWLPVGKTGRESFNGQGCTAYRETIKQGSTILPDVTGILGYVVHPDCSFQLIENDMPVFQGILVNQGKSIPYLVLQEGVTRSGEYTRTTTHPQVLGCERQSPAE